eukprot:m.1038120 g.1038120  ORF g.1038120 m.1038120 type:complete len:65 (-) comp24148_c0_seq2:2697-2891(-)
MLDAGDHSRAINPYSGSSFVPCSLRGGWLVCQTNDCIGGVFAHMGCQVVYTASDGGSNVHCFSP